MHQIYLARHGQSTWNTERRWAGHADVPLTDEGREQARMASTALAEIGFERITSSSLQRARETASIIANELELPLLAPVENFNERHYGELSGLTSPEIEARWPDFMAKWRAGTPVEIPGGEPWQQFTQRVLEGITRLKAQDGATLVIAHMGVLRALETIVGKPRRRYENLEGFWVDDAVPATVEEAAAAQTTREI